MPKRILDLENPTNTEDTIRVRTLGDEQIVYVCLSYCWGQESQNYCRLLQSNVSDFEKALYVRNLPATLRDSTWFVKTLGLRYVWIDALCIIQDDIHDWQEQAPCMGDIYRNAVLTIAATSSAHADQGLIHPRPAEIFKLQPCELFGRYLYGPVPSLYRYLDDVPIMRRAWTTQELYLSRRILYITEAFLAWECRVVQGAEGFPPGIFSPSTAGQGQTIPFLNFETKEFLRSGTATPQSTYESWQRLVSDYSSRQMTKEKDILVAIAGLAAIVKAMTRDDYLAGLWRGNLTNDLLWQSNESRSRSEIFAAPSWS